MPIFPRWHSRPGRRRNCNNCAHTGPVIRDLFQFKEGSMGHSLQYLTVACVTSIARLRK